MRMTELPLDAPEQTMFDLAGVEVEALREWLRNNNKALLVARDVTSRDDDDRQQPWNLFPTGGAPAGPVKYPGTAVRSMQFLQGDYVRGYTNPLWSGSARRVVARPLHEGADGMNEGYPLGQTNVANDGSMAMIVPAGRAVTWQSQDSAGEALVRERYWLSFRAGEIRTCTSCHAVNTVDQHGRSPSQNEPRALFYALRDWKALYPQAASGLGAYGRWAQENLEVEVAPEGDADGDQVSNLAEFVFGTDPNARQPIGGAGQGFRITSDGSLRFARHVRAASVRIALERSDDLKQWTEIAVIEGHSVEHEISSARVEMSGEGDLTKIELRAFVTAQEGTFFRLRFEDG